MRFQSSIKKALYNISIIVFPCFVLWRFLNLHSNLFV